MKKISKVKLNFLFSQTHVWVGIVALFGLLALVICFFVYN